MATKSPTEYHNHWGVYATPADLPNVLGSSTQDGALGTGDIAWVTSKAHIYQCRDATRDEAVWKMDARAIHDSIPNEIALIDPKAAPTTSDLVMLEDAAAANAKRKATIGTLPYGRQPTAIHDNVSGEIAAIAEKTAPVDADLFLIEDSEAADAKKRAQLGNLLLLGDEQSNLWCPPASAHSDDDEFDSATIDAAWEVYNHTGAAVGSLSSGTVDAYDTAFNSGNVVRANQNEATRKSWILLQPPASSNIFTVAKPATLATNELVMARLRTPQRQSVDGANEHMIGLGLYESVSSHVDRDDCVEMFLSYRTASEERAYFHRIVSGTPAGAQNTTDVDEEGQALQYVAIHKIGTTYHGWVGTAAGNWIYMGSQSFSGTVAYAGFTLQNVAVTAPGALVAGVDFIRFLETDNFLF